MRDKKAVDWVYLTTVQDQVLAEMLIQLLHEEGIEAVIGPGDTSGFLGVSGFPCRVMVDADRWREAMDLLEQWGEGEAKSGDSPQG